jgi:hypothetical protein
MTCDSVRQIADAVMYEGYMLYPYRASALKNRQRWTIGGLYPESYVERCGSSSSLQAQFLVECESDPIVSASVRFLHLIEREDGLQEGVPREVGVGAFEFPAAARQLRIEGVVEMASERLSAVLHRVTLRVKNLTRPDAALHNDALAEFASTHAIAYVANGAFISLTDPPAPYREAASQCINVGVWPVLAGDAGSRGCMLVSPIILSDYPQIAPESAGELFDGTEIDEILSLRILTLSDQEKEEICQTDDPAIRRVLARTESLTPEQLMKLHGVLRNPRIMEQNNAIPLTDPFAEQVRPEATGVESVRVFGIDLKRGDRVRLWPQKSSDIMDLALAGQVAEIESIEVDYEERIHLAVVLDDDPGKDLGALRQPGHRFFFSPDEVEPVSLEGSRNTEAGL